MSSLGIRFIPALLSVTLTTICTTDGYPQIEVAKRYENLKSFPFQEASVTSVKELAIRRNDAVLNLKNGKIYISRSDGDVKLAAFVGKGRLNLRLPNDIERQQVRRFLKTDTVSQGFEAALFYFSDTTFREISRGRTFETCKVPAEVRKLAEFIPDNLLKERGFNLLSRIAADIGNGVSGQDGLFFAAMQQHRHGRNFPSYLLLIVDPNSSENTALFQSFPHSALGDFYTISRFRSGSDGQPRGAGFYIDSYDLDINIKKNGEASLTAGISIASLRDSLRALRFDLIKDFEIDSVVTDQNDTLSFIKEEDEAGVTVILNKGLAEGDSGRIKVSYSGKLLERVEENYFLPDKLHWYPRTGYLALARYRMTFRFPKNLNLLSVGEKISEKNSGKQKISVWQQTEPVIAMAFALSRFDSSHYNSGKIPVTIYSTRKHRPAVREKIAGDVGGSLYFLQSLIGEIPYGKLNVVETPGRVSNSFPGTVFLTSLSFVKSADGQLLGVRAHEVSHQWWGNMIGWQTYHDQWLSEALAEYCGALLTQFVSGQKSVLEDALEGWRNDLLEKGHIAVSLGLRRFGFSPADLAKSDGLDAGPIWLGQRLGTRYPVDYYINVYEKGAYVIHMLRMMLYDFEHDDDSGFFELLRVFAQSYWGKRASTEDFKRVVTEHFGRDMQWFFEQWIYRTEVPTYRYDYKIEQQPSRYDVIIEVQQENVPANFRAFIPVTVVVNDSSSTSLIEMDAAQKSFRIGPFSAKPESISFNDHYGVLARVYRK